MSSFFPPSLYSWILPVHVDLKEIDAMALAGTFPSITGLLPAVAYAIIFGVLRLIFQTILFRPLAIRCMKLKFTKENKIPEVDKFIQSNGKKKVTNEQIKAVCASVGLSEQNVTKYMWNERHNKVNELKVVKFSEAAWRAIFYTGFVILGYFALFTPQTAVWIINTKDHFQNWPHHPVSDIIDVYYTLGLGCYIHQLMWTEVTRSDAAEMILHHLITILLIVASYLTNYTRIGASILFVHDVSDVFLEVGKCFNYMSRVKEYKRWAGPITDSFFACFAISFFVSRLIIYPRFLLFSYLFESIEAFGGMWPGYWYFAVLLSSLQCLHIFWFYLICRMIYRLVTTGIEKDERSDDDEDVGAPVEGSPAATRPGDKKANKKNT